ncbi:MAG: winged helix DNA-binding protein, partial [Alphaproteobacteria bacterium]|nr:winged helix DNA-binding protein [Alphaproteobacteria bacterium]
LGSNVSYNVRKMVENGYLVQERSTHDRRSIRVRLSDKGLNLQRHMAQMFDRHAQTLGNFGTTADRLRTASASFRDLERFWSSMLDYSGAPQIPETTTAA